MLQKPLERQLGATEAVINGPSYWKPGLSVLGGEFRSYRDVCIISYLGSLPRRVYYRENIAARFAREDAEAYYEIKHVGSLQVLGSLSLRCK